MTANKVINYKNIKKLIKKCGDKAIVLVGGCFDILHQGHLKFLEAAKKQGELLIVALESDKNIKRLKGKGRPINNQIVRAKNLAKLEFVDYILLLPEMENDTDYRNLVLKIKPKVIAVTKNDPQLKNKKKQARLVGGKVVEVIPYLKEYSTTRILETCSK